jgi:maleate isomerase
MNERQRRRIGLIVPSSNTVVESDFISHLPAGTTLHTARMHLAENTEAAQRRMLTDFLPQAVADIATIHPHVVACTTGGAMLGADGETALMREIAERTQAPVVSMNDAVNSAIERSGCRNVAVITPYLDELNAHIQSGLEARGLRVAHIAGMGIRENFRVASVTPAEIAAFAASQLDGVPFDLLYVPCANWRALEARSDLSARFGVPVITSDSATIEAALRALTATEAGAPAGPGVSI